MQSTDVKPRSNMRRWLVVEAVVLLLLGGAVWNVGRRAFRMEAAAASTDRSIAQLAPGSKTKLVLELKSAGGKNSAQGVLLEKQSKDLYRRTGNAVRVTFGPNTAVVMGKPDGIQAGAVVHVTGTVAEDASVAASQIVILTGYVRVQ